MKTKTFSIDRIWEKREFEHLREINATNEADPFSPIVRHLILPNEIAGSEESLRWLAQEVSPDVTVSIMSQYLPVHLAFETPLISRRISSAEYEDVVDLLPDLGMENGWIQDPGASEYYVPDFHREGHPFSG